MTIQYFIANTFASFLNFCKHFVNLFRIRYLIGKKRNHWYIFHITKPVIKIFGACMILKSLSLSDTLKCTRLPSEKITSKFKNFDYFL